MLHQATYFIPDSDSSHNVSINYLDHITRSEQKIEKVVGRIAAAIRSKLNKQMGND